MNESPYKHLESTFKNIGMLGSISGVLHWDYATYMPSGSSELRGEQLASLASIQHKMITDTKLSDLLDEAEESTNKTVLSDWQQANLREMRHRWQHANSLSDNLVTAMVKASAECEHFWREARSNNDFQGFVPYQENILNLVKEEAAAKAEFLNLSLYDALLDSYDPAMRCDVVDDCFSLLEQELPSLINDVIEKQSSNITDNPLILASPIENQQNLSKNLMSMLGFDFDTGRQDTSIHPFCGGTPGDIRITTRYDENDFTSGMFGILHETGHAKYEEGLPEEWRMQPVGDARGMSMHESQSLFIEMQLSRSPEFIEYITPIVKKSLGKENENWNHQDFFQHVNKVERSLIRVDADEVTYPTHVILRYNLEKAMISGELEVKDLPDAWNDLQYKLLGIKPDNYADGCMQDVHWPSGSFGYFPTYSLGAMIAAQLFDSANKSMGNLADNIRQGNLSSLQKWLKNNVHSLGSRYSTQEILEHATGKKLDATIFISHLKARYLQNA